MTKILRFLLLFLTFGCVETKNSNYDAMEFVVELNEDGVIKGSGFKKNNKKEGEWKFFVNDKLSSIIEYEGDLMNGKEIWFDRCSGRVIEEGENTLGKPSGPWYRYLYGELVSISIYEKDTFEIVYHNIKFKDANEIPPPPNIKNCD